MGNNGCGKSTILLTLAQVISRHHLGNLKSVDYDINSSVSFEKDEKKDIWTNNNNWWSVDTHPHALKLNGSYEGSLFYGTRFNDSRIVDNLVENGRFNYENRRTIFGN